MSAETLQPTKGEIFDFATAPSTLRKRYVEKFSFKDAALGGAAFGIPSAAILELIFAARNSGLLFGFPPVSSEGMVSAHIMSGLFGLGGFVYGWNVIGKKYLSTDPLLSSTS